MAGTLDLRLKLGLPPVSQIGAVVWDVERAAAYYSSVLGLGPFDVYEFTPDKHWYMEEPSPLKLKMGKSAIGFLELELIQVLEGKSLHQTFLEEHGEGIQHLGFDVSDYDYDKYFNAFIEAGFKPLMRAESYYEVYDGYLKACYFDTDRVGGIVFELLWRSWKAKH